jgi:uncharacterized membrane protein YgcG
MKLGRLIRHLCTTRWSTRARFSRSVLDAIEQAIGECEHRHGGEIRFIVETALDLPEVWRDLPPRQRALQLFGQFGVWDTAHNNGVLVYVLMADRDVEIVADRGIAQHVSQAEWQAVCRQMEGHFREGRFREGAVLGILGVGTLLGRHFPGRRPSDNELPNQPVLL